MAWSTLTLPKRPVSDNIPIKPAGKCTVIGGLPKWRQLPNDAKLPLPRCPKDEVTLTTVKLGSSLDAHYPHRLFDVTDLKNLARPSTEYNSLNDPHLRDFFHNTSRFNALIQRGEITSDGRVVCNLKQYNNYRRYLYRLWGLEVNRLTRRQMQYEKAYMNDIYEAVTHATSFGNEDSSSRPQTAPPGGITPDERPSIKKTRSYDAKWLSYETQLRNEYPLDFGTVSNWLNSESNTYRVATQHKIRKYDDRQTKMQEDWDYLKEMQELHTKDEAEIRREEKLLSDMLVDKRRADNKRLQEIREMKSNAFKARRQSNAMRECERVETKIRTLRNKRADKLVGYEIRKQLLSEVPCETTVHSSVEILENKNTKNGKGHSEKSQQTDPKTSELSTSSGRKTKFVRKTDIDLDKFNHNQDPEENEKLSLIKSAIETHLSESVKIDLNQLQSNLDNTSEDSRHQASTSSQESMASDGILDKTETKPPKSGRGKLLLKQSAITDPIEEDETNSTEAPDSREKKRTSRHSIKNPFSKFRQSKKSVKSDKLLPSPTSSLSSSESESEDQNTTKKSPKKSLRERLFKSKKRQPKVGSEGFETEKIEQENSENEEQRASTSVSSQNSTSNQEMRRTDDETKDKEFIVNHFVCAYSRVPPIKDQEYIPIKEEVNQVFENLQLLMQNAGDMGESLNHANFQKDSIKKSNFVPEETTRKCLKKTKKKSKQMDARNSKLFQNKLMNGPSIDEFASNNETRAFLPSDGFCGGTGDFEIQNIKQVRRRQDAVNGDKCKKLTRDFPTFDEHYSEDTVKAEMLQRPIQSKRKEKRKKNRSLPLHLEDSNSFDLLLNIPNVSETVWQEDGKQNFPVVEIQEMQFGEQDMLQHVSSVNVSSFNSSYQFQQIADVTCTGNLAETEHHINSFKIEKYLLDNICRKVSTLCNKIMEEEASGTRVEQMEFPILHCLEQINPNIKPQHVETSTNETQPVINKVPKKWHSARVKKVHKENKKFLEINQKENTLRKYKSPNFDDAKELEHFIIQEQSFLATDISECFKEKKSDENKTTIPTAGDDKPDNITEGIIAIREEVAADSLPKILTVKSQHVDTTKELQQRHNESLTENSIMNFEGTFTNKSTRLHFDSATTFSLEEPFTKNIGLDLNQSNLQLQVTSNCSFGSMFLSKEFKIEIPKVYNNDMKTHCRNIEEKCIQHSCVKEVTKKIDYSGLFHLMNIIKPVCTSQYNLNGTKTDSVKRIECSKKLNEDRANQNFKLLDGTPLAIDSIFHIKSSTGKKLHDSDFQIQLSHEACKNTYQSPYRVQRIHQKARDILLDDHLLENETDAIKPYFLMGCKAKLQMEITADLPGNYQHCLSKYETPDDISPNPEDNPSYERSRKTVLCDETPCTNRIAKLDSHYNLAKKLSSEILSIIDIQSEELCTQIREVSNFQQQV